MLAIDRLMPHFAAEVRGLDLRRPLPPETVAALRAAIADNGVLILRGQDITEEQHVAFARNFGAIEKSMSKDYGTVPVGSEVVLVTNVDPATQRLMTPDDKRVGMQDANELWHTDSTYKKVPAALTMLWGREVPPTGGDTQFADMRLVWDELPPERKLALDGLVAEHSLLYSRRRYNPAWAPSEADITAMAPVRQPLVLEHPDSARKSLYLASHIGRIQGMADDEATALVAGFIDRATRPDRVFTHRWRAHDLVIWDNRSVIHRARPYDRYRDRRVMHRVIVSAAGPLI